MGKPMLQSIGGNSSKYLRVSALKKGQEIQGTYMSTAQGKFGTEHTILATNSGKHNYKKQDGTVVTSDWEPGDQIIMNSAAQLDANIQKCATGQPVEIKYSGRVPSKKYPGKQSHSFEIRGVLAGAPAAEEADEEEENEKTPGLPFP